MLLASSLLVIAVVCLVVYLIKYNHSRKRLHEIASEYCGPKPLPLIGNAHLFMCKDDDVLDVLYATVKEYTRPNRKPVRFWMGPNLWLAFVDPKHVEKILSSTKLVYKHYIYDFMRPYLGEGLLTGGGPAFKKHKKMIQPTISLKFMSTWYDVIRSHTDDCLKTLDTYVDKGIFDIGEVIHENLRDIITESIMGSKTKSDLSKEASDMLIDTANVAFIRMMHVWFHPNMIYNLTKHKKREDKLIKLSQDWIGNLVDESLERSKKQAKDGDLVPIVDKIVEQTKADPDVMTRDELVHHIITLYAASEETIRMITGFLCVCLGMYPEKQEKLKAEIFEVFGNKPRDVTMNDVEKLVYLEQCLKEAIRLAPIGAYILRECFEETQLEDCIIPKGAGILIPAFNIHRDPLYWENPHHFHPEHFNPDVIGKRPNYAFLPFSAGPRSCVGKIFAKCTIKLFMASFFQRFELEADGKLPSLKLRLNVSVLPVEGYKVRIKRRVFA